VVDACSIPPSGLIVVSQDGNDMELPNLATRSSEAVIVTLRIVFGMIYEGSVDILDSLTLVDLGPSLSQELTTMKPATDWIASEILVEEKKADLKRSTEDENSSIENAQIGKKRYKKARTVSSETAVPLQVWDGKDMTRRRRDNKSILIVQSSSVDDWLDSYNSQL
jgi:hypothetical protein